MVGASPTAYAALLKAAYPAFQAGDASANVVFGGPQYVDVHWVADTFAAGATDSFDTMGLHPYMGMADASPKLADDGTMWNLQHVKVLHDLLVSHGRGSAPLWFTEFGWSVQPTAADAPNWQCGVTATHQATYLQQTVRLVRATMPYVTRMFWYEDLVGIYNGYNGYNGGYGLVRQGGSASGPAGRGLRLTLLHRQGGAGQHEAEHRPGRLGHDHVAQGDVDGAPRSGRRGWPRAPRAPPGAARHPDGVRRTDRAWHGSRACRSERAARRPRAVRSPRPWSAARRARGRPARSPPLRWHGSRRPGRCRAPRPSTGRSLISRRVSRQRGFSSRCRRFVGVRAAAGIDYPSSDAVLRAWFDQDWKCLTYLDRLRWPEGFICPHCESDHGWRELDQRWRCCGCDRRVSVTVTTIFHGTRTRLTVWFSPA